MEFLGYILRNARRNPVRSTLTVLSIGVRLFLMLLLVSFISDFNTFPGRKFQFRFGPLVMLVAVAMTVAMGLIGGLFPALRAVRLDAVKALREV